MRKLREWRPENLPHHVVEVTRVLAQMCPRVFVRSERLVHIGAVGSLQNIGAAVAYPIDAQRLTLLISTFFAFFVFGRDQEKKLIAVPPALVRGILAAPLLPFPLLHTVSQLPILLPSGELILEPGHHAPSQTYYELDPDLALPQMPARPNRGDARAALAELSETFCDSLFADARVDLAAACAAVMTQVVRPAIAGCTPVFCFDAQTPGIGKGETAHVVALVLTGKVAKFEVFGTNVEVEKRITAHVKAGSPVIYFDNITREIGGDALESAATSGTWAGRILGTSTMFSGPMRATIVCTGNALTFRDDMLRRVIVCRFATDLENVSERPLQRQDLKAWVLQHRGRLLAAIYTIPRAYLLAGAPDVGLKPIRGFDEWDRVVRRALVWAGSADPAGNAVHLREDANLETNAWRIALVHLGEMFPEEQYFTSKQVYDALRRTPGSAAARTDVGSLSGALIAFYGRDPTRKKQHVFGHLFKKMVGRTMGKLQLKVTRSRSNAGAEYQVVRVTDG